MLDEWTWVRNLKFVIIALLNVLLPVLTLFPISSEHFLSFIWSFGILFFLQVVYFPQCCNYYHPAVDKYVLRVDL